MANFVTTVKEMAGKCSDDTVGLVLRLNEDDDLMTTIFSESANTAAAPGNPPTTDRAKVNFRIDKYNTGDAKETWNIVPSSSSNHPAGFHAEEILISSWPRLLSNFNLEESEVTKVEMALSKSPCHGDQGSSPMIIGDTQDDQTRYMEGCSKKLHKFCKKRPKTEFIIYYIALAGAHAQNYGHTGQYGPAAHHLKRLMTKEERELDDARNAVGEAVEQKAFASTQKDLANQMLQNRKLRQNPMGLFTPNQLGARIGEANKLLKKANQDDRSADAQLNDAKIKARTTSLYTAQMGIVLLSSLVNVDVSRWEF